MSLTVKVAVAFRERVLGAVHHKDRPWSGTARTAEEHLLRAVLHVPGVPLPESVPGKTGKEVSQFGAAGERRGEWEAEG